MNANDLHASVRSHESGGAARGLSSSREADNVLNCVGGKTALSIFSPILQDEGNRSRKILLTFFYGLTLTVGTGDLRAVADVPLAVTLDDGSELVVESVL